MQQIFTTGATKEYFERCNGNSGRDVYNHFLLLYRIDEGN